MSSHSFQVAGADQDQRVDVFLTAQLPEQFSRTFVKKLIDQGCVTICNKPVKARYKTVTGDIIHVTIPDELLESTDIEAENIPLDIIHEDECLIVIHKPSGMLVHPATGIYTGTLVNALLYHCEQLSEYHEDPMRPGIVHRLDQETSGVIIAAKDAQTHAALSKQFQTHTIEKEYVALVEGSVEFDEGEIDAPIGRDPIHREKKMVSFDEKAKESFTRYKVVKRNAKASYVVLFPRTGRTHQLRVHMKYLRHPILGDEKYGKRQTFPRLALHARQIQFTHPQTKERLTCTAPVPAEFEQYFE